MDEELRGTETFKFSGVAFAQKSFFRNFMPFGLR